MVYVTLMSLYLTNNYTSQASSIITTFVLPPSFTFIPVANTYRTQNYGCHLLLVRQTHAMQAYSIHHYLFAVENSHKGSGSYNNCNIPLVTTPA